VGEKGASTRHCGAAGIVERATLVLPAPTAAAGTTWGEKTPDVGKRVALVRPGKRLYTLIGASVDSKMPPAEAQFAEANWATTRARGTGKEDWMPLARAQFAEANRATPRLPCEG
jgi:hypothetical protein